MKSKSKRHVLILEVLIAFLLVLIAFFPLISPHVVMMKEYKHFMNKVAANHLVNLIYVDLLEQLYLGKIEWYQLDEKRELKVEGKELAKELEALPFKTSFKITDLKPNKSNKEGNRTLYLMTLTLEFVPKWEGGEPLLYKYKVVVDHNLKGEATLPQEEINKEERFKELQKSLRGPGGG